MSTVQTNTIQENTGQTNIMMTNALFMVSVFSEEGKLLRKELWNSKNPTGMKGLTHWILERSALRTLTRSKGDIGHIFDPEMRKTARSNDYTCGSMKIRIAPISPEDLLKPSDPALGTAFHEDVSEGKGRKNTIANPFSDEKSFRKILLGTLMTFVFGGVLSSLIQPLPKNKEELIPPQYAKLILTPPKPKKQGANQGSKRQPVNVVQAFKSTEVRKSTQRLLKGGVLALLAKSNFLSDSKTKARVSAVFDQTQAPKSLTSLARLSGPNAPMNVALFGGEGGGGKQGSMGYGKGGQAGLAGQGNTFVSLNTPDAQVDEGLTKDEVGKVIHSHIAEVRYCYESAMLRNPAVEGKLVADFIIQQEGVVKTAKVNMSNVGDTSLDQCIISHLIKWRFPKPRGGIEVAVVYPFIFKSLGR